MTAGSGFTFRTIAAGAWLALAAPAATTALWLFDEPEGLYPSSALHDASRHGLELAMGRGAKLVPGRFGRALEPAEPAPLTISGTIRNAQFGLVEMPVPAGRTVPPMTWMNARFAALFTNGEKHLRTPGFANATESRLNLGAFDWTVEFWFSARAQGDGVVFEIGSGPRGENDAVTRLTVEPARSRFNLHNQPGGLNLAIPTSIGSGWHHYCFVYHAAAGRLQHYVDGTPHGPPIVAAVKALPRGEEAYFSVGRDGLWKRPLPGSIDELRFSDHAVYTASFAAPGSFSITYGKGVPKVALQAGPPLLFGPGSGAGPVPLGGRKHLFLDRSLIEDMQGVAFAPNPPRKAEKVLDHVRGHLSMVEDEAGLLRLYYRGPKDCLQVMTSRDGVRWEKPDLHNGVFEGERNVVVREATALGNVFLDPNAPPEHRWKYVSGIRRQAIFVFTSPDGWSFEPWETAALPFSAGSQSVTYYDDQRQVYSSQHRSDYGMTPGYHTQRRFVLAETRDILGPWPWERITPERTAEVAKREPIQSVKLDPWFLDNGPLTPSGIGIELPTVMAHENFDPRATDIYTTKAVKYPWAPDTYLAFPAVYFHYDGEGPDTLEELGAKRRGRGSGVTEVQLAVSRDGRSWTRYPRPAYVPIGGDGSNSVHMYFMTHGLVRRGNEIWQYVGGHDGNGIGYHSAHGEKGPWPLIRLVQRIDGFVAAEAAYTGGTLTTRPFTFEGDTLRLNIDTGAVGYAQAGFLDTAGKPVPGFSVDDCIYVNGDFLDAPVEWRGGRLDVSPLAGKTVRLVFRMRGAKLYAMQFTRTRGGAHR